MRSGARLAAWMIGIAALGCSSSADPVAEPAKEPVTQPAPRTNYTALARAHRQRFRPGLPGDPAMDRMNRVRHRRAVQAAVWGMPDVNYDRMRHATLSDTGAEENDVLFWSKPTDEKVPAPSSDAIYFLCFYNTKDVGPIVMEIPPAEEGPPGGSMSGSIVTAWQAALEDVGRDGADDGKGGKYLLLPPDYKEPVPDGYIALKSETPGGFALLRSNLKNRDEIEIARAVAYGKQVKVYPLAQTGSAGGPPATTFVDVQGVRFDSVVQYDADFFGNLDRIVEDAIAE